VATYTVPHHAQWFVILIYAIDYQSAINQFIILGKMYHSAFALVIHYHLYLR